jgi:hypothetical protein
MAQQRPLKERLPELAGLVLEELRGQGTISMISLTRSIMQERHGLSIPEIKELCFYMHSQRQIEYVGDTGVRLLEPEAERATVQH